MKLDHLSERVKECTFDRLRRIALVNEAFAMMCVESGKPDKVRDAAACALTAREQLWARVSFMKLLRSGAAGH